MNIATILSKICIETLPTNFNTYNIFFIYFLLIRCLLIIVFCKIDTKLIFNVF